MKKIYIDPGHGGANPGATYGTRKESEDVFRLAAAVAEKLCAVPGAAVKLSRTTDADPQLDSRTSEANNWGADYFISIHANASENPAANGTEGYVYRLDTPAAALATDIVNEIVRRVGTKNNGVIANQSFYVLRRTNMPSVLVELAYITNYEDAMLLANAQYQFAYGIYVGLLNYLGLPQIY